MQLMQPLHFFKGPCLEGQFFRCAAQLAAPGAFAFANSRETCGVDLQGKFSFFALQAQVWQELLEDVHGFAVSNLPPPATGVVFGRISVALTEANLSAKGLEEYLDCAKVNLIDDEVDAVAVVRMLPVRCLFTSDIRKVAMQGDAAFTVEETGTVGERYFTGRAIGHDTSMNESQQHLNLAIDYSKSRETGKAQCPACKQVRKGNPVARSSKR